MEENGDGRAVAGRPSHLGGARLATWERAGISFSALWLRSVEERHYRGDPDHYSSTLT